MLKNKHPLSVLLVLFFLVVPIIFLLLERCSFFQPLATALRTQLVSTGVLNYGAMGEILKQLGLVRLVGNDQKRFPRTDAPVAALTDDLELIPFQKKRRVDEYLYQTNSGGKQAVLVQFFPDGLVQKHGWPVLAIKIPSEDLYNSETGIFVHREKVGRTWERKAEVSIIHDGEVLFYSAAGLRLHGGQRRFAKGIQEDFRLYLRKTLGAEAMPPGAGHGQAEPVRTLVVKAVGWPVEHPINNPLALDISRKIGGIAPETALVELYLNGVSAGMAYVTEHLSRRQWDQYFADDEYMFYKFKAKNTSRDNALYVRRFWEVATDKKEFSMDTVAASIDIDNFSRHVFSWVFNGTTDACQGVGILDTADPQAKLRWINWDMDHSYWDRRAESYQIERENWQQEGLPLIFNDYNDCDRSILFSRLIKESSEYRAYFSTLVTEILNHRLTEDFMLGRVKYYRDMLTSFGEPHDNYIAMLTDFMRNRAGFLRQEMAEMLDLKGPYRCRVELPAGRHLLIDGYRYADSYAGSYFGGQKITVEVAEGHAGAGFSHWLVDGRKSISPHLEHILTSDTVIQAVYGQD